jgi:leucyl-tRNA synthetase/predicted alpha/beta hydrolase family esterase
MDKSSEKFDHIKIEKKLVEEWEKMQIYKTPVLNEGDAKYYSLYSFPYPSGAGLHVGHAEGMVANDIMGRYYRMKGRKVTIPMGWDAFGLPAENYAIKTGTPPQKSTDDAISTFIDQIKRLGISIDWDKEVGSHRPDYYKWTQWFFSKLYEYGLAYKDKATVNWCPKDMTVLANEQVIEGKCERCDSEIEHKEMDQWYFKITDYAERLIDGLEAVDWPEPTKQTQINWIGKSEGINITYSVPLFDKFLIASGNKSKQVRVQKIMDYIGFETKVLLPDEVGLTEVGVNEGSDIYENAKIKAEAYKGQIQLPIVGIDTALYIYGEEKLDPAMIKRNALEGVDEQTLSQEEIGTKMNHYYKKIAQENGGSVNAYFLDAFYIIYPDGRVNEYSAKRPIQITSTQHGELDIYFPLNNLYKIPKFDKYYSELTLDEEMDWLDLTMNCFKKFLSEEITVFTTRPDTNFGATFVVTAPESGFVSGNFQYFDNQEELTRYIKKARSKSNIERIRDGRKKTGEFTGLYAINHLTHRKMPIYISDFVLANVGTGNVVGVPGHDLRDFEFAQEKGIDILRVVIGKDGDESPITDKSQVQEDNGTMVNSGFLDGLDIHEATRVVMDYIEKRGWGKKVVNYKLRDWLISRQRYWGAPIPAIWKERERADRVFLAHGFGKTGDDIWFPWLKKELERQEYEVSSPNLPNNMNPELNEWVNKIEKQDLTERSSLLGHSMGAYAALKYAEKNRVKQLILIAPTNLMGDEYWNFVSENFPDWDIKSSRGFYTSDIDPEKISKNVEEIVFIFSSDDQYINQEIVEKFRKQFSHFSNVEFRTFINRGHFGDSMKPQEMPELLAYFGDRQYRVLDEKKLPMLLPTDVDFIPEGYSPLSRSVEYSARVKEEFGQEWSPEFDTMDTFVCSSWYYLRFIDPENINRLADSDLLNKWMPVDLYMIGAEHTVLHLMYSRFFTKFLFDIGLINHEEPFQFMRHMGIIRGSDNRKMSKRWGNVINPNDVVDQYGSDTLRMYEMFMGPIDQGKAWSDSAVQGVRRFLDRVYSYSSKLFIDKDLQGLEQNNPLMEEIIAKLIKEVEEDTENLRFNTAVSEFMKFMNIAESIVVSADVWATFLKVLAPYAPFMSEYLWQNHLNNKTSIHASLWPLFDRGVIDNLKITIGVQINGKRRGEIVVDKETTEEEIIELSMENPIVNKYIVDGYKKLIYIPTKVVNFIV